MAQAKRDENFVPTLIAVSSVDGETPITLYANPTTHRLLVNLAAGDGTVTDVSVVTANGFAGTVANSTTTPAITLTTTVTGILKGNGTAISAATAGTDYTALAFKTIAVSGQSDVVADSAADTLTLVAGTNVTITTDATADSITINGPVTSNFATRALDNLASVAINTALLPAANNTIALGDATHTWADVFLGDGAVINFNNGNALITHSAGLLTSSVNFAVPDDAYGAGWNGSVNVPTKNAIYDKVELLVTGAASSTDNAVTRFDSTTGKLIQNSDLILADLTGGYVNLNPVTKSGVGSGISFDAGDSSDDVGGAAYFQGGDALSGNKNGGAGNFRGGIGSGSGTGGTASLVGGNTGSTGTGGGAVVVGGDGGSASGTGGTVVIHGGNAAGGDSNGGDIAIIAGAKTGAGTKGLIYLSKGDGQPAAVLETSGISSSSKTFTFPNVSGTFALEGQVIVNLTAQENLALGAPVGVPNITMSLTNTKASYAKNNIKGVAHGITSPVFTGFKNNCYAPIGGNKMVYLTYTAATSDTLFVQAATFDPNTTSATVGTAVAVSTAFTPGGTGLPCACVCKLDTDKFIIFFLQDASTTIIKYVVGTVSGNTISLGSVTTASTAGSTVATSNAFTCDQLGTDKGIFAYKAATTSSSKMVCFTVSGTVATFGAEVTPGTNSDDNNSSMVKKIATDKYVLVTNVTTTSVYAQVCTVSGTTITAGTEAQISTTSSNSASNASGFQVVSPATDVFITRILAASGSAALLTVCTVSGTTPTAGSTATMTGVGGGGGIYVVDSGSAYVTGPTIFGYLAWTGTTITENASRTVNPASPSSVEGTVLLDAGYPVTLKVDDATNFYYWMEGMSNNWIGFAQQAVSAGAAVRVLVRGVDTNQSSLLPGSKFLVNAGTLTFIGATATVNTLDDIDVVTSINLTSVVF